MKKIAGCFLVLLLGTAGLAAMSATRLEEIATKDVIPEVRLAAGLALVDYYAANKTEAELKELATGGATEAIRRAATLALSRLWIGKDNTYRDLIELVNDPDQPAALRAAAVDALLEFLIAKEDSTLETLYTLGRTFEARYAGAKAYFFKNRGNFKLADLEAICLDEANSDGYRKAAAELLAGNYLFPPTTAKSQAELEDQAQSGENEYLRYAASQALSTLLIRSDLSEAELLKKVTSFYLNQAFTEEYKEAYIRALAARWAAGL